MAGLHKTGTQRTERPTRVDLFAMQTAQHVQDQWQGRFLVMWSPWRRQFTAISAVSDSPMIEDDSSIERLNGWMFRINAYATHQRARSLIVGLAV